MDKLDRISDIQEAYRQGYADAQARYARLVEAAETLVATVHRAGFAQPALVSHEHIEALRAALDDARGENS